MDIISVLVISVVMLVSVIIIFAFVDRILKGSPKKSETKTEKTKVAENPKPEIIDQEKKIPTMKIYNSELADDLNKIIEASEKDESSRIKIDQYTNKEGSISKYIKKKNYQTFDFGGTEEDENGGEDENSLSFTLDDYKRIVAISNIDDKK